MSRTLGTGNLTAGRVDVIARPRLPVERPLVVLLHTASSDASEAAGVSFPAVAKIVSRLAQAGYTVVAPTQGQFEDPEGFMGGALAQDRIEEAADEGRDLPFVTDAPLVLLGGSQGSAAALRRAALNPADTACVGTWLTVPSLDYAYQNDIGGFRSEIGDAFGVTWPTPLPAGSDPGAMTTELSVVPMLLGHADNDDFSAGVPPHTHPWPIETFAAATGATVETTGSQGHTDASIAATDIDQLLDFIRANT